MPNQPAPKSQQQSNAAGQGFSPYYQNQMQGPYFASPMGMAPTQPGMGAYGQLGQNFFNAPTGPTYSLQAGPGFSGYGTGGTQLQTPMSFAGPSPPYAPGGAQQPSEYGTIEAPMLQAGKADVISTNYTQTADPWAANPNFGTLIGGAEAFGGQAQAQAQLEAWEALQPQMLLDDPSAAYADLLNQQISDIGKATREAELKAAGVAAGAGIGTSTAFGSDIAGVGIRGAEASVQAQAENQVAVDQAMANYQTANTAFENAKAQWEIQRRDLASTTENAPYMNKQNIMDYRDGTIGALVTEAGQFSIAAGEAAWGVNPALQSDIKTLSLKLMQAGVDSWAASEIIEQLITEYERQNLAFVQAKDDGTYDYMGYSQGGNVNLPGTTTGEKSGSKKADIKW